MSDPLPHGATPLDEDEAEGLIPGHITTRGELNEWEQRNILDAEIWLLTTTERDVLTEPFVRLLHRKMFGDTWTWAGEFRGSNKNIGMDWQTISIGLRDALADARFWQARGTFSAAEAAVRFHHRLVTVHCFPNGNGRHARLCADFWLVTRGTSRLVWGLGLDDQGSAVRDTYIAALKAADREDWAPLLSFVGITG